MPSYHDQRRWYADAMSSQNPLPAGWSTEEVHAVATLHAQYETE